jgi:hypothetical protein
LLNQQFLRQNLLRNGTRFFKFSKNLQISPFLSEKNCVGKPLNMGCIWQKSLHIFQEKTVKLPDFGSLFGQKTLKMGPFLPK